MPLGSTPLDALELVVIVDNETDTLSSVARPTSSISTSPLTARASTSPFTPFAEMSPEMLRMRTRVPVGTLSS